MHGSNRVVGQQHGRVLWLGLALFLLPMTSCRYDLSFKSVELEGVEYDQVFETCHQLLRRTYYGTVIREDRDAGRLETGPVEFSVGKKARREQVYLKVYDLADQRVRVEIMAPLSEMKINLGEEPPVQWQVLGSDSEQEEALLRMLIGELLHKNPEALVLEAP